MRMPVRSSERQVRILSTVRLRFPGARPPWVSRGPEKPKGVSDGQQVDIPVLEHVVKEGRRS